MISRWDTYRKHGYLIVTLAEILYKKFPQQTGTSCQIITQIALSVKIICRLRVLWEVLFPVRCLSYFRKVHCLLKEPLTLRYFCFKMLGSVDIKESKSKIRVEWNLEMPVILVRPWLENETTMISLNDVWILLMKFFIKFFYVGLKFYYSNISRNMFDNIISRYQFSNKSI